MDIDLPYLIEDQDRHGNDRLYVRRNGKKIRMHEAPGTRAFLNEYDAALEKLGASPSKRPQGTTLLAPQWAPKTLGWLGVEYFKSRGEGEFLTLDEDSRTRRRNALELCFAYPHSDTDPDPMGNCPLKYFTAHKAKRLIEMKDGPGARTNLRKHLSALCTWAVDQTPALLPSNPVRDIKAGRRVKGSGFYTWTIPDVQQYLAYHRGQNTRRSRKAILALG